MRRNGIWKRFRTHSERDLREKRRRFGCGMAEERKGPEVEGKMDTNKELTEKGRRRTKIYEDGKARQRKTRREDKGKKIKLEVRMTGINERRGEQKRGRK